MASDRKQFAHAQAKWDRLASEGHFSKPAEFGHTAIITSPFTDNEPDTPEGVAELASFKDEALAFADKIRTGNSRAELAINASADDITTLIQDPSVSSMVLIGNGSLSALLIGVDERYDWQDAAYATTHLKQGIFVQRQCGGLKRSLNVPLGLFVTSQPHNVYAAVGQEFYPTSLDDPENEKILPVFGPKLKMSYDAIRALKPQYEAIELATRLAARLPKIPANDLPDASSRAIHEASRYHNYYERFLELSALYEGTADITQAIYVRTVKERFGFDLVEFYANNYELCEAIVGAVKAKAPYDELRLAYDSLAVQEKAEELPTGIIARIDRATSHPAGIDAIGLFYWGRINLLLEQAYSRMEPMTLNTPYLEHPRLS